jgi:hypothetical protein
MAVGSGLKLIDWIFVMQLGFQPVNIMSAVAAMGRLIVADGNTVRVCSLEGSPVSVPDLPEPDGRGGTRPVWKERLVGALDNPRFMWDGSFLWISDIQLRATQDNQVSSPKLLPALPQNACLKYVSFGSVVQSTLQSYSINESYPLIFLESAGPCGRIYVELLRSNDGG